MTRHKSLLIAAVIAPFVLLAWGCGDDVTCPNDRCSAYLPQTSPENVLHNLEESWEFREIDEYAKLLDPEFRFHFQPDDIPGGLEREYWNRDQDSSGTGALFRAAEVTSIRVDLGAFTVEDSVRVDQPDVKRIRLTHVKLEVEQRNGTTLVVEDVIEEFYFRVGRSEQGTDPTHWYIVEWRELRAGWGFKTASWVSDHRLGFAKSSPVVQPGSWGLIKSLYR